MAWFGAATSLLGLAGQHLDALTSGQWQQVVGFTLTVAAGIGLTLGGVLDNHRIRTGQPRPH